LAGAGGLTLRERVFASSLPCVNVGATE
jgi:hypothetical protein